MPHSLAHTIASRGRWLVLFTILSAPIGYVVRILLAGRLSVEDIGVLYGIISLITIVSSINDLGITESLNYFLPKSLRSGNHRSARMLLRSALLVQFATSSVLAVVCFASAPWLAREYFGRGDALGAIEIFSVFFLGANVFQWFNTLFRAMQDTLLQK